MEALSVAIWLVALVFLINSTIDDIVNDKSDKYFNSLIKDEKFQSIFVKAVYLLMIGIGIAGYVKIIRVYGNEPYDFGDLIPLGIGIAVTCYFWIQIIKYITFRKAIGLKAVLKHVFNWVIFAGYLVAFEKDMDLFSFLFVITLMLHFYLLNKYKHFIKDHKAEIKCIKNSIYDLYKKVLNS